jgi:hypothetical protein
MRSSVSALDLNHLIAQRVARFQYSFQHFTLDSRSVDVTSHMVSEATAVLILAQSMPNAFGACMMHMPCRSATK